MSSPSPSTTRLPPTAEDRSYAQVAGQVLAVLALLFVFLLGIYGLGQGFRLLGSDLLDSFFNATANPFVGLTVGILATTLVQSSSVTTSMIVALCAAPDNPLPIANAVPMIMGANIGTTVTNTIVSLAHMGRRHEFIRAFSAATCHDFFNWMAVLLILPLEMATGFLTKLAGLASSLLEGSGGFVYKSPLKVMLKKSFEPFRELSHALFDDRIFQAVLLLSLSGVLILVSLYFLTRVMRSAMRRRMEGSLRRVLGHRAVLSMAVGMIITILVQSSSITTAILVPVAAAGVANLRQIFPITLGANIGTTITALLASLATSGPNAHFGVQIALVHLLFNLTGILLIYPVRRVRYIPMLAAQRLARVAVVSKKWALLYLVLLFYLLPAGCILLSRLFG